MDAKKFAIFLRKIISEEVRIVVREEMTLMREQLLEEQAHFKPEKQVINERIKPQSVKSSKLRQVEGMFRKNQPLVYQKTGDPIKDLLEETRLTSNFTGGSFGGGLDGGMGSGPRVTGGPEMMSSPVQVVESVQDMIANAEPVFQPEFARVDSVPDFTGIMSRLKEKGQL